MKTTFLRCLIGIITLITWTITSAQAEIKIATVGPFTGRNVFRGEQIQQGAELAVQDINERGGVLGQQVVLSIVDDACDPELAVAVAKKLVAERVVFVAGHVCSGSSIPASKIYEKAGILMISPASTNPKLTDEGGDNVFRVVGRDDQQGLVAGNYLADVWDKKKIAILHDGSTYGKGLADQTQRQLKKRGISEALNEAYAPGARDQSALVTKLQEAKIDVIYIGGYSADAGLIVRQARDRGYNAQVVAGDAVTNEEFWMITGEAGNGTLVTFGPDPRVEPAAASVVKKFADNDFDPVGYTLHTYAAIQVWAQAAEAAGSLELEKVVKALRKDRFKTVLGELDFDDKGDVIAAGYIWYAWKDGTYKPLP